jgi:hypothetical protein
MLIISAAIMSVLEGVSYRAESKFPVVACSNIGKAFTGKDRLHLWEVAAVQEYKLNMHLKEKGLKEHFNGVLECFC